MSPPTKRPFDSVECSTPHDLLIRCSLSNLQFPAIALTWCGLTSHRHRSIEPFFMSLAARDSEFRRWSGRVDRRICQTFAASRQSWGNSHWGLAWASQNGLHGPLQFFPDFARSARLVWLTQQDRGGDHDSGSYSRTLLGVAHQDLAVGEDDVVGAGLEKRRQPVGEIATAGVSELVTWLPPRGRPDGIAGVTNVRADVPRAQAA